MVAKQCFYNVLYVFPSSTSHAELYLLSLSLVVIVLCVQSFIFMLSLTDRLVQAYVRVY